MNRTTTPLSRFTVRFAFAILLAAFFAAATESNTFAKDRPNFGRVEISTSPGGYPVLIDGRAAGETTESVRLIELTPGKHTVEIVFPNGTRWARDFNIRQGRRECIALRYNPRTVSIPRSPCPYPVSVSAPAAVTDGDVITFASDASYTGNAALNYTWTVSPASARITSGAGTPSISVDTTNMGRQRVTAILMVDDGSGERMCRQTAQASTAVNALAPTVAQPRRFDEFPSISFDDDKARLDNLAIELQNNPGASSYIIVYAGSRSRAGQADRLGIRTRNYLTQSRGIDASRVTVVNGGYREQDTFELWLVPQGATAPQATPTLSPDQVRPAPEGRPSRRRGRRD